MDLGFLRQAEGRRVVPIRDACVGFKVPDVWVISDGLDVGGTGRALPYVAAVES